MPASKCVFKHLRKTNNHCTVVYQPESGLFRLISIAQLCSLFKIAFDRHILTQYIASCDGTRKMSTSQAPSESSMNEVVFDWLLTNTELFECISANQNPRHVIKRHLALVLLIKLSLGYTTS